MNTCNTCNKESHVLTSGLCPACWADNERAELKKYYVADESGGYAETFTWDDAIELAKNDSIELGGMFHVSETYHPPAIIFYAGKKYIPASDTCSHEWEPLYDDDDGWYLQVCKHCGLEDSGVRGDDS